MPYFTITSSARATITETWLVEAGSEAAARERFDDQDFAPTIEGGKPGMVFCSDAVAGDEEDREIISVEPDDGEEANRAAMARRGQDNTPAMFSALKLAERFIAGFEGDEMQEGVDALLLRLRETIRTIEEG